MNVRAQYMYIGEWFARASAPNFVDRTRARRVARPFVERRTAARELKLSSRENMGAQTPRASTGVRYRRADSAVASGGPERLLEAKTAKFRRN